MAHVWYVVRYICNQVYYFDRMRILYKEVHIDPMYMRIQCPYGGTYLLFADAVYHFLTAWRTSHPNEHFLTTKCRTEYVGLPSNQHFFFVINVIVISNSWSCSKRAIFSFRGILAPSLQMECNRSVINKHIRMLLTQTSMIQLKKKTKVTALEWQGKAYYVTGKENA